MQSSSLSGDSELKVSGLGFRCFGFRGKFRGFTWGFWVWG